MQGLQNGNGGCGAANGSPPGLAVALPSAKDALVNLSLPNGGSGFRTYKSHMHTLAKHSGLFAAASRQGTEFKVAPLIRC